MQVEIKVIGVEPGLVPVGRYDLPVREGTVQGVFRSLREAPGAGAEIGKVLNEDGTTRPTFGVLVNGRNIKYLEGPRTPVNEGDTIHISVVPFPHKRVP